MTKNDSSKRSIEDRLESFNSQMEQHVSLSERVLEDLASSHPTANEQPPSLRSKLNFYSWFGELTMAKRIGLGGMSAALSMLVVFWVITSTTSTSLAQVLENVQRATSYSADSKMLFSEGDGKPNNVVATGRMYWRDSGAFRMESKTIKQQSKRSLANDYDEIQIAFTDKDGIRLNPRAKTYSPIPARRGYVSPIMMLQNLADFKGVASKQLGKKEIAGINCEGFELAMRQIDANAGDGTMTLWVDRRTQLPVLLSMRMSPSRPDEMVLENFTWNAKLSDELFSTEPPEGFTVNERRRASQLSHEQRVEKIVEALRVFAELNDGMYPQVKVIYGDVTHDKLMQLAGYAGRKPGDWIREENYRRVMDSTRGWALMNEIQRDDADAAYYGLDVTPSDEGKVLFRWKLDDGGYQAIYGDLHTGKVKSP